MASRGGASGKQQGLTRAQTILRNNYIDAYNAGDMKAVDKARRAFKKSTGKSISEYVNLK